MLRDLVQVCDTVGFVTSDVVVVISLLLSLLSSLWSSFAVITRVSQVSLFCEIDLVSQNVLLGLTPLKNLSVSDKRFTLVEIREARPETGKSSPLYSVLVNYLPPLSFPAFMSDCSFPFVTCLTQLPI